MNHENLPVRKPYTIANIRLFIAFRIFFNSRFYYPVFTILFLDYGLTIEQFSILNTVWAITIVLAEVPSGALADLFGRKQLLVLTSILMILELSVIAFVPIGLKSLVFWAFLCNRILSGLAEAMASGADEAIAYDSLVEHDLQKHWPEVLSLQMRFNALAGVLSMTVGALVYDPQVLNRVLGWFGSTVVLTQQVSMRFPVFLTLLLGFGALFSTLRLREIETGNQAGKVSVAALWETSRQTLSAGAWIIKTPFALVIILFGMMFDHILRLIITLASQYFRQISLPEASFGLIMALLSLLGLVIPKGAEWMVKRFSAAQNGGWLALLVLVTLWGLAGFVPYGGIIPMALVMTGLMLTAFFTSHYLNQITASSLRATVLSFKGLAFNLAYGVIGLLFALLIYHLRQSLSVAAPEQTAAVIEELAFKQSFQWFPWYGLLLIVTVSLFASYLLRGYIPASETSSENVSPQSKKSDDSGSL